MQKVYFIPGLGADKRAFSFLDLAFCTPVFINWITPLPNEPLPNYAQRLTAQIKEPNAIVVGLSFGGMLATEIAKNNPQMKVILISSNKTPTEFPKLLKIGKFIPAYKWLPNNSMKKSSNFFAWLLGAKGKEQRIIQQQIAKDTNPAFTKWAIYAILHWKNTVIPSNVVHIHGTADKLLPYRLVKADYTIEGGEHLMIMDKAKEVSALLKQLIEA
ncbi:MAG: alpha/beta hydrolase [Chitinophagaceae bacterium]|jgi:pimeloyl-ACP methyl ester carboxylesterase|nr:alpha/beta hydrolase [Chitinophagaceae bacterium]